MQQLWASGRMLRLAWHCSRCSPCCLPSFGQLGQMQVLALLLLQKGAAHLLPKMSAPLKNASPPSVQILHSKIKGTCAFDP